jgi:PAS domain S-box-containing protein
MSPITAWSFLLLGLEFLFLDAKSRLARWIPQLLPCGVAIAAMFGFLDFVLDANTTHTYISPVTASVLLLLACGLIFARTGWGMGALVASAGIGGTLTRRLLPSAILIPLIIGWLRWKGQSAGLYSDWTGVALMTVTCILLLAGLTTWTGFTVDRSQQERRRGKETVDRLASIIECSNDAIIGKSTDGIVTSWNPGAEAIYGYSAQEIVGQPISIVIPRDRQGEFDTILEKVRQGQGVSHYETKRLRKDGQTVFVSLAVSPVKDKTGRLIGVSTIARDVTERRRSEEKLHQASLYARSLIEASLDPLVTISKDGKIMDVNRATELVTGLERDKLIGSDFSNYFTDPESARRGYEEVFAQGAVQDYPLAIRHVSGKVTDVLYNATVFKNEAGEVEGVFAAARDVTEKKQAQEAVAAEREKFNNILDVLPPYVVLLTPDYHVAFANREFKKRFGESNGRRCYEFLFGRSDPCEICETYKVLPAKKPLEWKWTGPDGCHYDIYDFPFTDTDGASFILEMGIDVTQRKVAEAALQESEEKFRTLAELAPQMVWACTPDGLNVYFNPRWVEYTGLTLEESYGRGWKTPFHPDDRQAAWDAWNHAIATGDTYRVESRLRAADGSYRWFLMRGVPLRDASSGIVKWFGTCTDIDDLKGAEAELSRLNEELEQRVQQRTVQLHESEERVRRKLESILSPEGDLEHLELADLLDIPAVQSLAEEFYQLAHIPMFILDLKGNPVVAAGWQEICTKFHRVHPDACKNCRESDQELSAGVAPGAFKLYQCKNHLWDVVTPLMLGEQQVGNLFSGQFFFTDETVDREMFRAQAHKYGFDEQEYLAALDRVPRLSRADVETGMTFYTRLAQLLSQLSYSGIKLARSASQIGRVNAELAASIKELEAFTYSVSHDLRAPLRHISGFSRILKEEFGADLPSEAQHHLQRIQEGTQRMGMLVDDLLNLARVGRRDLSLQVSGLKSIVDEVIADLAPECGDRQIEWKVGNLPFVECDPGLLKQVIHNLLSNAVKFTRPRSQAVIEVGQKDQDGTTVVFVRDNGVGFNMKYADKLFGVFQRLHRPEDFEGTGVGLATVQRIIQKHGGRIWVEAELDKGAMFYFTLGMSEKTENKTQPVMAGDQA